MEKKVKIFLMTLGIIGILLLSILVVTTQNEITTINKKFEDIEDQPLGVRILADTSSGTSPLTVNFKPLITNNKGEVKYHWEFGDGNTSYEQNPSYVYKDKGTYSCSLHIENTGISKTDSYNITVFPNNPPKVKIICATTVFRPKKVVFDAEVFDPEGEELQYSWLLKHPPRYGSERKEPFSTKNFSKTFIRNGRYVVELTVTDESGNKVTDYEIVNVQKSQPEILVNSLIILFGTQIPDTFGLIWSVLNSNGKISEYLDNHWLDWPPFLQNIINRIIKMGRIDYEPPVPKAELEVSEITNINLSQYVNETGVVEINVTSSSSFTITNIDPSNIAEYTYISLDKPYSEDQGLVDEIEKENITVSLEVGPMSNKLFYNRNYTNWEDCYNIEKLAQGDSINLGISVTLKEGGTFIKGEYPCTLYLYQEKTLDKAELVDEIPFTIIL